MRSSIVWSIVFSPVLSGSAGFLRNHDPGSAGAGAGQRRRNAPRFGPDQRSGRPNPPFAAGARPCSFAIPVLNSDSDSAQPSGFVGALGEDQPNRSRISADAGASAAGS